MKQVPAASGIPTAFSVASLMILLAMHQPSHADEPSLTLNREHASAFARLAQVVRRCADLTPKEVVAEIFADLDKFNTERFDDQTLMVMRIGAGEESPEGPDVRIS